MRCIDFPHVLLPNAIVVVDLQLVSLNSSMAYLSNSEELDQSSDELEANLEEFGQSDLEELGQSGDELEANSEEFGQSDEELEAEEQNKWSVATGEYNSTNMICTTFDPDQTRQHLLWYLS